MNLAKSLIISNKNYFNHRAPMQWNGSFWPKISLIFAFRQAWLIRYSRTRHAVHSYLRNRTTAQTEYLMGNTVAILLKLWVCKLSFLKRQPSNQKGKNETPRTYRYKRNIASVRSSRLTNHTLKSQESSQLKSKYGIELPASIRIISVQSDENLSEF
jgi:hypothetical protein